MEKVLNGTSPLHFEQELLCFPPALDLANCIQLCSWDFLVQIMELLIEWQALPWSMLSRFASWSGVHSLRCPLALWSVNFVPDSRVTMLVFVLVLKCHQDSASQSQAGPDSPSPSMTAHQAERKLLGSLITMLGLF